MSVVLGYWDIRGRAEPIRYLLRYVNAEFHDKRYTFGKNVYDLKDVARDWLKDKFIMGLDFPNLPYYIEGDVKLTQSKVILQYLGRKHGLIGRTEAEKIRVDVIEGYVNDIQDNFTGVLSKPFFNPKLDFEEMKAEYLSRLDSHLTEISNFLDSHDWMAGTHITYVDFYVYEILQWNRLFSTQCLNNHKNLMDYLNRFESLPQIKGYINSDQFKPMPITGPVCLWGWTDEARDDKGKSAPNYYQGQYTPK